MILKLYSNLFIYLFNINFMNKKSRSVLITGANKGIGLALVKKLCSLEKFHIIMAFRSGNNGVK